MNSSTLTTNKGTKVIVDEDIALKFANKKIHLNNDYPAVSQNKTRLHRLVISAKKGEVVDHINRNKLDCRRQNLRMVSKSQNALNRINIPSGISGFRNVHYHKDRKKCWCIIIRFNCKRLYHGTFHSRFVAGLFADKVLEKYVGPFVDKNFNNQIRRTDLKSFMENTHGRIFSVVFSRREDGRQRFMLCRIGVRKNSSQAGLLFDPSRYGLLNVYDLQKKEYRFITLDNVICLTFRKTRYSIVA